MQTIAVFVNDAEHARAALVPLLSERPGSHWIVVACAPRMARRIGKWTAQSTRDHWRMKWAQRLIDALRPTFEAHRAAVTWEPARAPLSAVIDALRQAHGDALLVFDARCSRFGTTAPPHLPEAAGSGGGWVVPLALSSGVGLVLALSD